MSEWKAGAADRRDSRATKDEPTQRVGSRRKDTRRWCKGKIGREHTPIIELNPTWPNPTCNPTGFWPCKHQERCTTCGKVLQWALDVRQCPTLNKEPS